ncbi:MAG: 3-deoxy-manno-octulosonate cytidylyltransferase [candidate division Zixibacteria bacterium]
MAHVTAIIPARLASKRFSRKVLYPLKGKPLIFYVWKAARKSKYINQLFVATDSTEIGAAVNAFGGAVIMTSKNPRNGTERTVEAVKNMRTDIVVNIQADNIGLTASNIDSVIKAMAADKKIQFATLAQKIEGKDSRKKLNNINVVKVIETADGHTGWFSRHPIPLVKGAGRKNPTGIYPYLEHIGVYFFRKQALMDYKKWPRAKSEAAESLEQLRILENGGRIKLFKIRPRILQVDSKQTLKIIDKLIK